MASKEGSSKLPSIPERGSIPFRVPNVIKLTCQTVRVIGRNPGRSGVTMQSRHYRSMISRRHASVGFDTQLVEWVIKDLDSLNGVHVNGSRIAAKQDFVLHDGDRVVFGLNTDLNELSYVFIKTSNRLSKLSRVSTTPKRKFERMKIDGRPPLRYSRVQATEEVPSPTINESLLPDSSATVDEEVLLSDSNATVDSFDSSPILVSPSPIPPSPILVSPSPIVTSPSPIPPSPILVSPSPIVTSPSPILPSPILVSPSPKTPSPILVSPSPVAPSSIVVADSSNDVIVCSSPPRKKARTNDTLDSLFDAPTAGTSATMEEELFGRTPTLTPRARAVLKGIGMTATDIQVELARNEIEKEKKIVESKYKVLQNELASKEQKSQEKAKLYETIEQELICVICQELLIRAHTLSCSHSFCEYCITEWRNKTSSRFECPICRTVIKQKPVRSLAIDNVIRSHVANLPREQQISRQLAVSEHYRNLGLAAPLPIKSIENASSLGSAAAPIVISNSP